MKSQKNATPKYLCATGASAGGLDALSKMLQGLPEEKLSLSILVAQHLSPSHKSHLVGLLGKNSKWPVKEAQNGELLEEGVVYITPPNNDAKVIKGHIVLSKPLTEIGPKPSVDILFQSLAKEKNCIGIGVILSGTGRDGSLGSQALKAAGGYIIIQEPKSAAYDGMPLATYEQGVVDARLVPEEIGKVLKDIALNIFEKDEEAISESDKEFAPVFDLLEKKTGVDFADYKINTIKRRLYGRLNSLKINSLKGYLEHINDNPTEVDNLFNTVLIGVTQFFRDPELFNELRHQLEKHISAKNEKNLRVWVPGCATGEEAYSIGILIHNILGNQIKEWSVQIFATDIDDEAISTARRGLYPKESIESLSEEYLRHYFIEGNNGFEVIKEIRSLILFSRHDLSSNPPFLKLDLISCRNLLIYFKLDLQKRVLPIFHYALLSDGLLFLGKSENLGVHSEKFNPLSKKAKIYSKVHIADMESPRFKALRPKLSSNTRKARVSFEVKSIPQRVEETLYNQYGHPYAVVNDHLEILYISGNVEPFMQFNQGVMTANLIKQCRKKVELIVHTTVQQSIKQLEAISSQARKLKYDGETLVYRIVSQPMLHFKETYFLVLFESFPVDNLLVLAEDKANLEFENIRIAELELELDTTKEHLQSYIEELETANEEMQALNEELQSTNEELQSVNEELETSNEEMQSTNEEMQIAYQELRDLHDLLKNKEKELLIQNERLGNLINNNLQAFLLMNSELQVLQYNEQAVELVQNLTRKKLSNSRNLFTLLPSEWTNEIGTVFEKIRSEREAVQLELSASNPKDESAKLYFILNFSPIIYDNELSEISLGIIDITDRKVNEIELEHYQSLMNEVGSGLKVGGWELDLASGITKWTREIYKIHDVEEDYLTNLSKGLEFYPSDAQLRLNELMESCISSGERFDEVFPFTSFSGESKVVRVTGNPVYNEGAVVRLWGVMHDITEIYHADQQLKEINEELKRSNSELQDFAYVASHDLQEPLRMVSSFSQLFYERYKDKVDEKGLSYLTYANDGAQRMQEMLGDLLQYSRIGSNKEKPKKHDLNKIITKALQNLKVYQTDRNAEAEVAENLGSVNVIETQMIRLFQNLIANAWKFNETETPKVTINRKDEKDGFTLSISDNGIGINPEYHEQIFSIFSRLHTKESYSGNGMGLAICKRIAGKNGFDIQLESDEGKGSVFSLKFKL